MQAEIIKTILFAAIVSLAMPGNSCDAADMDIAHAGPVMNYHRVDERLVTGGHLMPGGLATLKEQGIKVVIDLRDHPPAGEAERLAEYGITWINVPVAWGNPTASDFDQFSALMGEHEDAHVMVQCAANYRASAMTYLYQVLVDGVPEAEAKQDLHAIWNPDDNDTWHEYIEAIKGRQP